MKKRIISFILVGLISQFFIGCSSGDGDSGPMIPENAVSFSLDNASEGASISIDGNTAAMESIFATMSIFGGSESMDPCVQATEIDPNASSGSGMVTMTNCPIEVGYSLSANINFNYSFNQNNQTGEFAMSGGITMDTPDGTIDISNFQMNFTKTETEIVFYMAFTVSSDQYGGFALETTNPITFDLANENISGTIMLYGADNTRVQIDIATDQVLIDEGDGNFVPLN